jgi:hypothetical protein
LRVFQEIEFARLKKFSPARGPQAGEGLRPIKPRTVSARWSYCPACALRACRSASLRNVITATLLVRE